ncbi:MAG: hypothetical protein PHC62_00645 [Candidatus Izemoplasmatales bacterium]|nr:hypothetical protein [Candidatus Izemoplasmatales bacterium]
MPNTNLLSELIMKKSLENSDIIIVEDKEDTKQSTIESLKKNFNGDTKEPSNLQFYSSAKVDEIKKSLQKDITAKASHAEVLSIKKSLGSIIEQQTEQEQKDIELIIARDGCDNLKERLDRDKQSTNSRTLKKYKRSASGTRIFLGDFHGYGDILVDTMSSGNLIVANCNYFDIERIRDSNNYFMTYSDYGFTYTQRSLAGTKMNMIPLSIQALAAGTYYFSANLYNEETTNINGEVVQFKLPTEIQIELKYADRSMDYKTIELTDNNSNLFFFDFTTTKTLVMITLYFPVEEGSFIEESTLTFDNIMLTPQKMLDTFIEYGITYYPVSGKQYVYDVRLDNCEVYFEGFGANLIVDYYNDAYDTEYIIDAIQSFQKSFYESTDHCGLATNYGIYNFLDENNTDNKNPECGFIEVSNHDKYIRNSHKSTHLYLTSSEESVKLSVELEEIPDTLKYVTFLLYMDKYISYYMDDEAITVYLVSDNTNVYPPNNYFKKVISKDVLIQGWNSIKTIFDEYEVVGSPNKNDINHVVLEFSNNVNTVNKSIYINSIIFNQSMKPTLLLGFNGVYDNTFSYTLPMLQSRGIPCSIFLNSSSTLSKAYLDAMIMYHLDSLDIGQFGCNPDKELLLNDNNYREQYLALKNIRDYLQNNMVYNPITYSAPYGNLRPITAGLIKDMGYQIAKTGEDGYCSFFTKHDLCIPSIEINNSSDIDYIKEKIDYAIATEQTVAISTYDVTEYGDEMNAKRSTFENIINYIEERFDTNQINVMSYRSFYNKCID